ncbi:MAG TPA: PTS sugar transporter subunit IIC [Gemmatimonadales bacterium]|nr:PTS sugar transporter subunit IIC [Gemmatimonadales bacterium]
MPHWWGLLAFGAIVGLDLVSFPQMMLARPIVAGAGAGLLLGDVGAGLRLGVLFELFQYDILPVGATRYPEYGPATVIAVGAAHAFALPFGIGLATVVGLFTAMIGGISLQILRRLNTRAVTAAAPALERGDVRALYRLHFSGAARDLLRAALVTAFGLVLVAVTREFVVPALSHRGERLLSVAATGAGLAAGAAGTLRLVGLGTHLKWLAAGLVGGIVLAWMT